MGAGASASALPVQERRAMYEVLREKYTRSDLDTLAAEEQQAWLEVIDEGEHEEENGESRVHQAAEPGGLSKDPCPVTVRDAAAAAAARTGDPDNIFPNGGSDEEGIRPQGKKTRMSYHLAPDGDEIGAALEIADGKAPEVEPQGQASGTGTGVATEPKMKHLSGELPAWKRTALAVETHNEISLGDIVRVRDPDFNGMWFEGVLAAIHDEATFTVELTAAEPGGSMDCLTVGINDIVRIMPWYCIEVDDVVECQLEDSLAWVRGTVARVLHAEAKYNVLLDSSKPEEHSHALEEGVDQVAQRSMGGGDDPREAGVEGGEVAMAYGITESRIRKITSGRQAVARRWKKVYLASCLASGARRAGGNSSNAPP